MQNNTNYLAQRAKDLEWLQQYLTRETKCLSHFLRRKLLVERYPLETFMILRELESPYKDRLLTVVLPSLFAKAPVVNN
jgi:hypothetical protein